MPSRSTQHTNSRPILLIDSDKERANLLCDSLRAAGYQYVLIFPNTIDLIDHVIEAQPAMILIDVESPTRDTLEQLTILRDQAPHPVIMFSQDRDLASIDAAIASGVSAYVTDGIDSEHVQPAIAIAQATFRSLQQLRNELHQAQSNLDERKLIERAKGQLMEQYGLSEDAAYKALRKAAMDQKVRLVDVARALFSEIS